MQTIFHSSGEFKPSSVIIPFPSSLPTAVHVEREFDGNGWLVRTYNREYGWLFGDYESAFRDANAIAATFGVTVISSAGVMPC
jgi:hypothetical protein